MLNVLWSVITPLVDFEMPTQDKEDIVDASLALNQVLEQPTEAINLILGLTDLLDDRVNKPLTDYSSHWWAESATEAFGQSLERLTKEQHAWLLFRLLSYAVDTDEFQYDEEMNDLDEYLDSKEFNQSELIRTARGVAAIAVEHYFDVVA